MRLIDVDALGIGRANPDVFEEKAYAWGVEHGDRCYRGSSNY